MTLVFCPADHCPHHGGDSGRPPSSPSEDPAPPPEGLAPCRERCGRCLARCRCLCDLWRPLRCNPRCLSSAVLALVLTLILMTGARTQSAIRNGFMTYMENLHASAFSNERSGYYLLTLCLACCLRMSFRATCKCFLFKRTVRLISTYSMLKMLSKDPFPCTISTENGVIYAMHAADLAPPT